MKLSSALCLLLSVILISACARERQRPVIEYTMGDPVDTGSRYATLLRDNNGRVFMSWLLNLEENLNALEYTWFDGRNWREPLSVGIRTDYTLNHLNFPAITVWDGAPVAAKWQRNIQAYPGLSRLQVAFLQDNGRWGEAVNPMENNQFLNEGHLTVQALDSSRVLVVWSGLEVTVEEPGQPPVLSLSSGSAPASPAEQQSVDEQEPGALAAGEQEPFQQPGNEQASNRELPGAAVNYAGQTVLRSVVVHKNGEVTNNQLIDETASACSAIDMVHSGNDIYAVYRRASGEITGEIALVRYNTQTGRWREPVPVASDIWQRTGCPVEGPRIDAINETIAVGWTTGATDTTRVMAVVSRDGGETFGELMPVEERHQSGRTDVAFDPEGNLYISWMRDGDPFANVMLHIVPEEKLDAGGLFTGGSTGNTSAGNDNLESSSAGNQGAERSSVNGDSNGSDVRQEMPLVIGNADRGMASGYPRMAMSENGVVMSWTQTEPFVRVRNAYVPYDDGE